ncbi:MAG: hypothetical protein GY928_16405 [Colwellia sp.]|nr:hypothetical protein [Colwellia sp.]
MAGENNATTIILQKGSSPTDIIGQGEFAVTFGGEPITFENKSAGDWVQRLDNELSGKELVISGALTYNSDTVYREVQTEALTGTQDDYLLTFPDGFAAAGKFVPHGMSMALPRGGATVTTITFSSHGEVTYTAAT